MHEINRQEAKTRIENSPLTQNLRLFIQNHNWHNEIFPEYAQGKTANEFSYWLENYIKEEYPEMMELDWQGLPEPYSNLLGHALSMIDWCALGVYFYPD